MESPTIRTRSGSAAVGVLRVRRRRRRVVVAAVPPLARASWPASWPVSCRASGPDVMSPTVPPGRRFERPVIETMCESCSPRLSAATGPVTSRLMVRRVPDRRHLRVVLQRRREQQEPHGEGGGAEREDARPRQAHPAVRRAPAARRAGATRTPTGTPSPRGAGACGRRSSEAVVDEGRDADGAEGGDAEQGEAEQADLHRGPLARERRLQAVDAQRGHELRGRWCRAR